MRVRRLPSQLLTSATGGQRVPVLAKAGAIVIVLGLIADLVEHTLIHHDHEDLLGAFPIGEHAAHLVVLVGMVLVLVGVVVDGIRSQRRFGRQEGSTRDAVR